MSASVHFDGGRLRRSPMAHQHVVEHDDGQVSAMVVRGVPALVCELCEESYYEPAVTDEPEQIMADPGRSPHHIGPARPRGHRA